MTTYLIVLLGAAAAGLLIFSLGRLVVERNVNTVLLQFMLSEGQTAQERDIQKTANYVALGNAIGVFVVVYIIWGFLWLATAAGLIIGILTPTLYREWKTRKTMAEIDLQLPAALQLIGNSFKANRGLQDCISDVAMNAPPPINLEFAQISREANAGGIKAALREAWHRLPLRNFRTTVMVLQIVQDRGGDLAATASELADTFRETHKLESKSKTASQQTRAAMILVSIAPVAILLMMFVFQPDAVNLLLGTQLGWMMTAAAAVLYIGSLTIMRKLMSVKI